jgi:hemolysin activation/secretion protein
VISRLLKVASLFGLLFLVIENAAWSDTLPGAAQPQQIDRSLNNARVRPMQTGRPSVSSSKPVVSPLAEEAQKITFLLKKIILSGNHVYQTELLEDLYKDKLNKKISVADLFAIVESITDFYRNNGYVLSQAILPPQSIKNGIVEINIIEGFIDQVSVTGKPYYAKKRVYGFGEQIRKNPPLQITRMEKYLLLANEIPATQVRAVLEPSKVRIGGADLVLVTDNKPLTGYLSYDDYGNLYTGPQEMTANLALNSILVSGDSTQGTVVKTPKGQELLYNDLNYNVPLYNEGVRWLFDRNSATTHPLFVLQPEKIQGISVNYSTTLQYPVIRTPTQSLNLQLGFIYADTYSTTFGQQIYTDHIRSLELDGLYNFSDRFYGSNSISGMIKKGLPLFGFSPNTNPLTATTSRPGGYSNYLKLVLQLSRTQFIKGPFSLYGLIRGQTSFTPLLSGEQFSYGGSQLGRGYDVAELLGDKGIGGTVELHLTFNPEKLVLQSVQFYLFYDAGCIWNFSDAVNTETKQGATSTGLGARITINKYLSGNLMWTQPLTKYVAAEQLIGNGRRPRTFFSIVAAYD